MKSASGEKNDGERRRLFRMLLIFTTAFVLAFGTATLVRAADALVL